MKTTRLPIARTALRFAPLVLVVGAGLVGGAHFLRAPSQRSALRPAAPDLASAVAPIPVDARPDRTPVLLDDGAAPAAHRTRRDRTARKTSRSAEALGLVLDEPTEKDHLIRFRALASADLPALEASAPGILLGGSSADNEKVALLRALNEVSSPLLEELCVRTAVALPDSSGPHGQSVPAYAVRVLGERADEWPAARRALMELVWGPRRAPGQDLRRQAASRLVAAAPPAEQPAIEAWLDTETDAVLRAIVQAALAPEPSSG